MAAGAEVGTNSRHDLEGGWGVIDKAVRTVTAACLTVCELLAAFQAAPYGVAVGWPAEVLLSAVC
jgi:hypothetical protein